MNRALTSAFLGAALPFLPGAAKGQLQTSDGKLGDCAPSFAAPVVYTNAGRDSYSVAVADLNGDGNLDLVTANFYVKSVSVLLGKGDGTFQPATNYSVGSALGSTPIRVTVGDFDGDGKPDLATANGGDLYGSNTVSVLLGNGDGTFKPAINNSLKPGSPSLATGDFNGDGWLDLALVDSPNAIVSLLLGNGDGTFRAGVDAGVRTGPAFVLASDVNGDGKLDLCVLNNIVPGEGSVLLGGGDGAFQPLLDFWVRRNYPRYALSADLNYDGKLDLAVANRDSISVLLGNGDGTFKPANNYDLGGDATSIAGVDFNGDGKIDLAVPLNVSSPPAFTNVSLVVLLSNGDGTFQSPISFDPGAGIRPWAVAVGDFNRDGKADVAVTSAAIDFPYAGQYGVSVLLNTCPCAGIRLGVARTNTNLILSWPLPYSNFILEAASSLASTNWQQTSEIIKTNNGRYEVDVPLDAAQRYFRLRKP